MYYTDNISSSTNVPLLHSLKTSKNRRFPEVFRGYRSRTFVENELKAMLSSSCLINLYLSAVKLSACKSFCLKAFVAVRQSWLSHVIILFKGTLMQI